MNVCEIEVQLFSLQILTSTEKKVEKILVFPALSKSLYGFVYVCVGYLH